ncbi:hypothetical protein JCM8097_005402 [Rhodosporidiobolus ruineniae]
MGLPTTPSRTKAFLGFPSPNVGPLASRANTPEPQKRTLAPLSTKAALSPKDAVPSTVFSASRAVEPPKKESLAQSRSSDGWKEVNGKIYIVEAATHQKKLASGGCSWLHSFEHARYLHAGLSQGAVRWPDYPYKIAEYVERPALEDMHNYLSSLSPVPHCESKPELQAAFQNGSIHFTGSLNLVKEKALKQDRLVFKLNPPTAGMGCALYRRFGSDRFFRISLDDEVTRRAAPSFDSGRTSPRDEALRSSIETFFAHPLFLFGRTYRPFCWKDGAAVYWCESGDGLETIPLVDFAERYLEVSLNGGMSVAKYASRFELGLTTTTPTVTFRRERVFRTPDLTVDSLKMSLAAMQVVVTQFRKKYPAFAAECLSGSYLPSCIRSTVHASPSSPPLDVVYQLDYSSLSLSSPTPSIEAYPFFDDPSRTAKPIFRFSIEAKDGTVKSVQLPPGTLRVQWVAEKEVKSREDEVVMTDGCSLISFGAMQELARLHAAARGGTEMEQSSIIVPAVAQGRIGGGKGVWAVAPPTPWSDSGEKWIEVRDSQWKFKQSHRQTTSLTFELHSSPAGKGASKLGKQAFEVLAHCGVPSSAFRDMLRRQIDTGLDAFLDPDSLPALLYTVEKASGVLADRTTKARLASDPGNLKLSGWDGAKPDDEDGAEVATEQESGSFVHDRRLDPSSGAPNTVAEVVIDMLQAGFDPKTNAHAASKLQMVMNAWVRKQTGFKVDDEFSRTAFVVADHLGILNEGEFFYQTSADPPHPRTVKANRSPAIQPCDIQRATGVFVPEYASYHDVIVVSAKGFRGARSLCSVLSGGDYDGDKLVVTTNPSLLPHFDTAKADPSFADPPFADTVWFDVDRRKVKDVVAPLVAAGDNSGLAKLFMEGLFSGTQYGTLSTWHTTLAYTLGLDHPLTSEVGHLFCKALDGRKQGLTFSAAKWAEAKKKFHETYRDKPSWTWREDGGKVPNNVGLARRRVKEKHVMDELVAEGEEATKKADRSWLEWCTGRQIKVDPDLAEEWWTTRERALREEEELKPGAAEFVQDLETIRLHVQSLFQEYKDLFQRWQRDKACKMRDENATSAHGSPTKSPSKQKGAWKASSRSQKEELLKLSRRFWSILEPGRMGSYKLQGPDGARAVRALTASCAYIEPLHATKPPPSPGSKTLLDRLQAASKSPSRLPSISSTSTATLLASNSSLAVSESTTIVVTAPPPAVDADGDEVFVDAEGSFPDDDITWSQLAQLPTTASQVLAAADSTVVSSTTSSQTLFPATTAASSSHPSGPPSPTPAARISKAVPSPAAASAFPSHPIGPPAQGLLDSSSTRDFASFFKSAAVRFCFDMAHRDVMGLKADALTRRLHGGERNEQARGISAPRMAPMMLDVHSVSKKAAGITKARSKVRPRTLLTPAASVESLPGASPAKKARRA